MNIRTINELFYQVVERNLDSTMMFRRNTQWISLSGHELYRNTAGVARSLEGAGIGKGDRVAILSENRPEWATADFASMLIGAVVVPIYPTLTREQTLAVLRDSGARVIFVSTVDQLRKVHSLQRECALEKVIMMDYTGTSDVIPMQRLMHNGPAGRDEALDARALSLGPDELATIIYTSGTTGVPKGAMLTQHNLAANLLHSLDMYEFRPGQVNLSFLPLAHVTARHADYAMLWHGVTIAYCPFVDELSSALAEINPNFFVAVPRVYEKVYNQVRAKMRSGFKRKLYNWALVHGRAQKGEILAGRHPSSLQWRLADRLLFSKVKRSLGKGDIFISGGAPLSRDLLEWYASIGIRIYEGYGLTETSPVIAVNNPRMYRAGSVGPVLKNVEVRIAEDGEILVKGPSVFKGYWNMPDETAAAFEEEWFRTGDIGRLDEDGFLYVTDRKKDLIKISGGKFIAPQPIESSLKSNALVAEAAILGDRRKFCTVVLAPNFAALEDWARQNGIPFSSREELIAAPQVYSLYKKIVAGINRDLAQFEKIKKVLIVAEEFSIANGFLTPTMKLKRRAIEERYRAKLDELYNSNAEAVAT